MDPPSPFGLSRSQGQLRGMSKPRYFRLNLKGTHAFACSSQFPELGGVRARQIPRATTAPDPSPPLDQQAKRSIRPSPLHEDVNPASRQDAAVDSAPSTGDLKRADGFVRERSAKLAPKEQPPRKLSGKGTARRQHSGKQPPRWRLTDGVGPYPGRNLSGSVTEGAQGRASGLP